MPSSRPSMSISAATTRGRSPTLPTSTTLSTAWRMTCMAGLARFGGGCRGGLLIGRRCYGAWTGSLPPSPGSPPIRPATGRSPAGRGRQIRLLGDKMTEKLEYCDTLVAWAGVREGAGGPIQRLVESIEMVSAGKPLSQFHKGQVKCDCPPPPRCPRMWWNSFCTLLSPGATDASKRRTPFRSQGRPPSQHWVLETTRWISNRTSRAGPSPSLSLCQ